MNFFRDQRVRVVTTNERLVRSLVGCLVGWDDTFLFVLDDDGDYIALNRRFVGAMSVISATNP